ncbi:sugar transferase [Altererythrobacter aurantiacus]|uniref:Sugar transferase n=1 Tax=Parapontixanthobacter aurantiacus TaxID=1463599 RepID=A0A844ZIN0_9SPHN|nr:sugar transferase [Parapontixanthobacter aurantiacus]MXO86777.1 sugar transferase [Parapontixanthobacter aurantiacus]
MLKRAFDVLASAVALTILLPICALVAIAVRLESKGPVIFRSERFGKDGVIFLMPKFRTMKVDTPQLPTHLLGDGRIHLTRIGGFLRRSSLDELPQLWSVLKGDMSLVGPRPALFNQHDLMGMRREAGVDVLRPGITGWAQVNGRDELSLARKVAFEKEYLSRSSLALDLQIIWMTVAKVLTRKGVSH